LKILDGVKKKWEKLWLPRLQEGKKTNWVWYHTLLAIELLICDILLVWIAIVLTIGVMK